MNFQHWTNHYIFEKATAIFIFMLIISGNFLAELFPCRIQKMLKENIYVKHLVGFLTLFFFGVLTIPDLANIGGIINSFLLYLIFVITANVDYKIWIVLFVLYAIMYLLHLIKQDYTKIKDGTKKMHTSNEVTIFNKINIEHINKIQALVITLISVLTIVGFIIYMGEKKLEYGKKFKYSIFFTGKTNCQYKSPTHSLYEKIVASFR